MNGLWTVEFGSSAGVFGTGVVVLRDGEILGGDASHYYIGTYQLSGTNFHAVFETQPFIENARSVFNTVNKKLTLDVEGSIDGKGFAIANGHPREAPHLTFGVKLTKRF